MKPSVLATTALILLLLADVCYYHPARPPLLHRPYIDGWLFRFVYSVSLPKEAFARHHLAFCRNPNRKPLPWLDPWDGTVTVNFMTEREDQLWSYIEDARRGGV